MDFPPATVLITDDNADNRNLLAARLRRHKHRVEMAADGREALEKLDEGQIDLLLLDIMMPNMNGFEVLERVKSDPKLRHIPVIMISALDDVDSVVRCIQLGAEDHLPKPFNPILLRARINASLEKKRLRDKEQAYLRQIERERAKSDRLLRNILPDPIVERLKQKPGAIADHFESATVLFADLVDFTAFASKMEPATLVELLNSIFERFDAHAARLGLEKIKTIGDEYMAVGGLPEPCDDHAVRVARLALAMQRELRAVNRGRGFDLALRIGINTGPVVAGVIGTHKFSYDLWGDTVNIASRMQQSGELNQVQVTRTTREALAGHFEFHPRGLTEIKGRGSLMTYFLGKPLRKTGPLPQRLSAD